MIHVQVRKLCLCVLFVGSLVMPNIAFSCEYGVTGNVLATTPGGVAVVKWGVVNFYNTCVIPIDPSNQGFSKIFLDNIQVGTGGTGGEISVDLNSRPEFQRLGIHEFEDNWYSPSYYNGQYPATSFPKGFVAVRELAVPSITVGSCSGSGDSLSVEVTIDAAADPILSFGDPGSYSITSGGTYLGGRQLGTAMSIPMVPGQSKNITVKAALPEWYDSQNHIGLLPATTLDTTVPACNSDTQLTMSANLQGAGPFAVGAEVPISISATEPSGSTATVQEFDMTVISAPDGGGIQNTVYGGSATSISVVPEVAGNYVLQFIAKDSAQKVSPPVRISFDAACPSGKGGRLITSCSTTVFNFQPSNPQVAQSAFLDSTMNTLIAGKPIMAQIAVTSSGPFSNDASLVPVVGVFSGPGGSFSVGGCFALNSISSSHPVQQVPLFMLAGSTGFPFESGSYDLSVQVNPTDGITGPKPGICGGGSPAQVLFNAKANQPPPLIFSSSNHFTMSAIPSASLEIDYVQVNPACSGSSCDYNSVNHFQDSVAASTDVLAAMFPLSPVKVNQKTGSSSGSPSWSVIGDSAESLFSPSNQDKELKACPIPANPSDPVQQQKRNECLWTFTVKGDLEKVREAVVAKDSATLLGKRFIGVVSKDFSSSSLGYFSYLAKKFGAFDGVGGVTEPSAIPDVGLVTEDFEMIAAHELGHTYKLRYPSNSSDPIHQKDVPDIKSNGYWVAALQNGSEVGQASFMTFDSAGGTPADHWMDTPTYSQLLNVFYPNPKKSTGDILDNQLFVDGFVSEDGRFILNNTFLGSQVGLTTGTSNQDMQFSAIDPSGATVSQVSVPLSFTLIKEGTGIFDYSSPLAAVSTGVPFPKGAFKIQATSSLGRPGGQTITTVFYPAVEALRTTLGGIPRDAFLGDPVVQFKSLASVLDQAEDILASGDLNGARQLIAGKFASLAVGSVSNSFQKTSTLDVGLSEVTKQVQTVTNDLASVSQSYPATSNGLIRVITSSQQLMPGSRASFSVVQLTRPQEKETEMVIAVTLNGQNQKVNQALPWSYQTPLLTSGKYDVSFHVFFQNAREAKALNETIESFEREEFNLQRQLENETDPLVIAQMQSKIHQLEVNISALKLKLTEIRLPAGNPVDLSFEVR